MHYHLAGTQAGLYRLAAPCVDWGAAGHLQLPVALHWVPQACIVRSRALHFTYVACALFALLAFAEDVPICAARYRAGGWGPTTHVTDEEHSVKVSGCLVLNLLVAGWRTCIMPLGPPLGVR